MEIAKGLHIVDGIKAPSGVSLNPLALFEDDGTVHLVDCGFPGQARVTLDYLASIGTPPSKVKSLILTHYDPDHVGSAAEIQRLTGCSIMAPEFDERVISGERFTDDQLKELFPKYGDEELAALQVRLHPDPDYENIKVDKVLREGDVLYTAGETVIYHIPGHTPGLIVLFFKDLSCLAAVDSIKLFDGKVGLTKPPMTASPKEAAESLWKLKDLDFEILIAYHSPPLMSGGSKALREYLGSLEQ